MKLNICDAISAKFYVNIDDIKTYCLCRARDIALNEYTKLVNASEYVDQFFLKYPINAKAQNIEDIRPNKDGTFLQQLAQYLVEQNTGKFKELLNLLPSLNIEEARKVIARTVQTLPKSKVQESSNDVLHKLHIKDLNGVKEAIREYALKALLQGDVMKQHPSLGCLIDFLRQVKCELRNVSLSMPETISLSVSSEKAVQELGKRTLLETLLLRPHFNKEDILELIRRDGNSYSGIVVDQFLVENYEEMHLATEDIAKSALDEVERLLCYAREMEHDCRQACLYLEKEMIKHDLKIENNERPFNYLFAIPDQSLDAISEKGVNRLLKPIEENESILIARIAEYTLPNSFFKGISQIFIDIIKVNIIEEEWPHKRIIDEIMENLCDVKVNPELYYMYFSFVIVLERNRKYWNAEIKQRFEKSRYEYAEIEEYFRKYLGTELIDNIEGKYIQLPPIEILKYTIIDTFAYYGKPHLEMDPRHYECSMKVFVPFKFYEDDYEQKDRLTDLFRYLKSFALEDISNPASNIYEYTSLTETSTIPPENNHLGSLVHERSKQSKERRWFSFDLDHSLDYYHDPAVRSELIEAERKDGKSIFDAKQGGRALGYISPFYVRNQKVSDARWKPWMPDDESLEETSEQQD